MSDTKHVLHALLGAVSIFAIGVVGGVLLDRAILHPSALSAHTDAAARTIDATHESFLQEMRADLGLTERQASQVQEIFARHQAAVNEAWSAVHTRLDAAIDSVTTEIEAVLDLEQRFELHEWLMEKHGVSAGHGVGEGH
jgi:hypothetical protein